MDPISLLAITVATAIVAQSIERPVRLPRWLFDEIWSDYMGRFERPTDYQLVHWDQLMEQGRTPYEFVPPGEVEPVVIADHTGYGDMLYFPTEGEISALQFIGRRCLIAEVLHDSMIDYGPPEEQVTAMIFDPEEVRRALALEGIDRVPMLSDDTTLQAIVWSIGPLSPEDLHGYMAETAIGLVEHALTSRGFSPEEFEVSAEPFDAFEDEREVILEVKSKRSLSEDDLVYIEDTILTSDEGFDGFGYGTTGRVVSIEVGF